MDDLRFTKNKKSIQRAKALAIAIVILALVMLGLGTMIISSSMILSFLILLGFGIYLMIQNFGANDTVVVNQHGINSRVNAMGRIDWEHIEGFEIRKAVNTMVLVIKINDPEKLLSTKNKASKALMRSNIKRLGSPVVIPEPEFHEPLNVVKEKMENYRQGLLAR